jgi:hypothetical protein
MPLYYVTFKDSYVDPKKAETADHIVAVKRFYESSPRTFTKILRILDEAIDSVEPSATSKLVWTKTGALFGHNSPRPLRDVEYVWEKVIGAVGDDKNCLIAMGSLFRWRISLLTDTWLVFRQDSENIDPSTGKKILISTYWIDNTYRFMGVPPKKTKSEKQAPATEFDFSRLANKFGGGREQSTRY